jgi:hypothetical protein
MMKPSESIRSIYVVFIFVAGIITGVVLIRIFVLVPPRRVFRFGFLRLVFIIIYAVKLYCIMKSLNASPLEVVLFMLFVGYLVFQPNTPSVLVPMIDNTFGVVAIIVVAMYLLLFMHPVLGVLSVFVAYEILRRTNTRIAPMLHYTDEQPIKDAALKRMNPPLEKTLEETMVDMMAPIGSPIGTTNGAKPMAEKIHNASMV